MSDRRPSKGIHAESGILRKAKPQHTADAHLDDLLVFGYACKIFRDNDRASEIDHGKHLIPWMNDHTLKIDRLITSKRSSTFLSLLFNKAYRSTSARCVPHHQYHG